MNYELAKELKDAGFPQGGMSTLAYIPTATIPMLSGNKSHWNDDEIDYTYVPTLSELIEACGKTIENGHYEFFLLWSIDEWFSGYMDKDLIRIHLY